MLQLTHRPERGAGHDGWRTENGERTLVRGGCVQVMKVVGGVIDEFPA